MLTDKERLLGLLRWCEKEVLSHGGDGSGALLSKDAKVQDIYPLVQQVFQPPWRHSLGEHTIEISDHEECFYVTNSREFFDKLPNFDLKIECW